MLSLSRVRVSSFDLDYLDVTWEVASSCFREDPRDYSFRVLRAETETGPYTPITREFSDRYRFRDPTALRSTGGRKWYYRIRVAKLSDSSVAEFPGEGGASLEAEPDLESLEISRQIQLRLNEYTGRDVYLLPRKTFGQRCPVCYDFVTQMVRQSGCLTCFDTSFVGGYHSPVRLKMGIASGSSPAASKDQSVKRYVRTAEGKLANYPEITEGSVVIEAENLRWEVLGPIRQVTKLRALVRQQFSLGELPQSDVMYKYPLKVDDASVLEPTPYRQFTLPADPLYYSPRSSDK